MATTTAFVGRASELSRVEARLTRSADVGVVVRGAAGIGKSRLVAEAVDRAPVLRWLRATSQRPVVPFADDLQGDRLDPVGAAASLREQLTDGDDAGVLVVDDAHHLDAGAAAVVSELIAATDIKVVLTIRDDEPLSSEVEGLIAGQDHILLDPLPDAAIGTLVEDAAGASIDASTLADVVRLADGNPLFARELVHDAVARGQLVERSDGTIELDGAFEAPAEVTELIDRRTRDLPVRAGRLLRHLSLAEPLPIGMVHRIATGPDYAALDRADLVRLVAGKVTVTHPMIAEVVSQQLDATSRAELSGELLRHVGRDHPDGPLRAASWALDAGAADVELLLEGAHIALARLSHELAERLAAAAIAAGASGDAELVLAGALGARPGGGPAAEERFAKLEAAATGQADLARIGFARARNLLFGVGRPDLALAAAERSTAALDAGPWRTEVRAITALTAVLLGEVDRAVTAGEGLADADDDPRSRATVEVAVTLARTLSGRLGGTRERIDLARALLAELPARDQLPLADEQLALTTTYLDAYTADLVGAARHAAEHLARVVTQGSPMAGTWAAMSSHVALLRGDVVAAAHHSEEAIAALGIVDVFRTRPIARCQFASAQALRGRVESAERALADLLDDDPEPPDRISCIVGRADALRLGASGDADAGARRAVEAAETGLRAQHRVWAALAAHVAVRLGATGLAIDLLRDLAREVDGGLVALLLADAEARVGADDAEALLNVGDRFVGAGARLLGAEAYLAAASAGADPDRLRRRAAAVLFVGERPWTVDQAASPAPLSEREREIATLAATGTTNRAIGGQLGLAPRTVETHLAATYRKVGATGRRDLQLLLPDALDHT